MNCKHYEELLSPYLDDALSDDEKLELEAHLNICPTCKEALQKLQYMMSCLNELEDEELPEGFHVQLHERLMKEEIIKPKVQTKNKKPYYFIPYVSGLVAAIFIAFIIGPYLKNQTGQVEPMTRSINNMVPEAAPMSLPVEDSATPNAEQPAVARSMPQVASEQMKMGVGQEVTPLEEEWTINTNDLEALKTFIISYCEEETIDFNTWEESGVVHFVLEPNSKEDFKQKLSSQLGGEENIQVIQPIEEPIIHLVINNES